MEQNQFVIELLQSLGIAPSQSNVDWINQWIAAEGPYGTQTGPLNIFSLGNTYSPQAIAAWLNTNGNIGGIGTYAQNIAAYLNNQPNNLGKSLAWFSGQSGNPSNLTASYQQLINANPNQPIQGKMTPWGGYQQPGQSAAQAAVSNVTKTIYQPLVNALESGGLLIAAALLIGIGGLWLVLSNKDTQTVIKEGVKTAVVA